MKYININGIFSRLFQIILYIPIQIIFIPFAIIELTVGIGMSNAPEAAVKSFLRECGLKMTEYIQFVEKLVVEPFYVKKPECPVLCTGMNG